ncbi:outer membrane protein transport protein [Shewanella sp. HL-SH2]|uniref:outer membrane protein transport protein n=1 Tax=Shewanella sp. HL-SH2 TaxID=3436238 RepID=UPI003EB83597
MTKFNKTLLAAAVALASAQATAAGFQLNSQSAAGIGRAMAGDAIIADNASVLARNPAAMALFDQKALSLGVSYADVNVEVTDAQMDFMGRTFELGHIDNAAEAKVIPNAYFINPVNDTFAYGFAAFSNYGTGTDLTPLANNHGSLGPNTIPAPADLLGNTEVTTVNLNASASYRINESLSLGLGLDVIQASGTLTRNSNILGSLVDVEADGWALGGIVGLAYEINPNNRFGLSYRFSPEMNATGDVRYLAENFDEINIPIADIAQFAGFHQLTEKFAVHYTAQWTQWSSFDQISLNEGDKGTASHSLKEYHWKDSWFLSLGATYDINNNWTVRTGIASDDGVVGEVSSLSIPDSDRMWYSAGFTYNLSPKSSLDFGITKVVGEKVHVIEQSGLGSTVNAFTESGATYYSAQYNYKF